MSGSSIDAKFLDVLAHELRAPLFPIIALSDLMHGSSDADLAPDEVRAHAKMINTSGQELLRLIGDLVEISRIDVGRCPPTPGRLDLEQFARTLSSDLGDRVDVAVQSAVGTPFTDRSGAERVARGLVAHALDETDGGVALTISADATRIAFSIDTPAMSDEERQGLFEPFWRREDDRPRAKGLGLTLALVDRIAQRIGGSIVAEPRDAATRTVVALPARAPVEPSAAPRRVIIVSQQRAAFAAVLDLLAAGHAAELTDALDEPRTDDIVYLIDRALDADGVNLPCDAETLRRLVETAV